jgi:hypothetical protein
VPMPMQVTPQVATLCTSHMFPLQLHIMCSTCCAAICIS